MEEHYSINLPPHEEEADEYNDYTSDLLTATKRTADGTAIFNPHNHRNVEITEADIKRILTTYGLPPVVTNMTLYRRAFIHPSYLRYSPGTLEAGCATIADCPHNCLPLKSKSYQRLEFIGDGVLELVTKYYLYRRFPKLQEGPLTRIRIDIVRNIAIGKLALEMGLNRWLVVSHMAEQRGVRNDLRTLGCLFEAFCGALFLDMNKIRVAADGEHWIPHLGVGTQFITGPGFQMTQVFIEAIFRKHLDWTELITTDDNHKNTFQQVIQKAFKTTPHYLDAGCVGSAVAATTAAAIAATDFGFNMGVYLCLGQAIHEVRIESAVPVAQIGSTLAEITQYVAAHRRVFICFGTGQARLKRDAEQAACLNALRALGL